MKRGVVGATGWGDGVALHLTSSMIAGLVTTTITNPIDVIKTRMFVGEWAGWEWGQGVGEEDEGRRGCSWVGGRGAREGAGGGGREEGMFVGAWVARVGSELRERDEGTFVGEC